ncbi:hypothetical protein KP509_29G070600 [Ceratopteris richardii]|nr:hypothetical protein KP509_29G070600 [Ceratopteris richardii]
MPEASFPHLISMKPTETSGLASAHSPYPPSWLGPVPSNTAKISTQGSSNTHAPSLINFVQSAETIVWESLSLESCLLSLRTLSDSLSLDCFLCIIHKCRLRQSSAHAMLVHLYLCSHGVDVHYVIQSHIVTLYVECGSMPQAQMAFNRLTRRSEFVWTSLMNGYVDSGKPLHSLGLGQAMREDGIEPSKFTLVTLIKACARLQWLERGQDLHKEVIDMGLEDDPFIGSVLVDMYAKCGSIMKAQEVFDGVSSRSIVSWTALIAGYTEHGQAEKALKCLDLMSLEGLSPDIGSYICSIKACGNLEDVRRGHRLHSEAMKKGLERDQVLNHVLIDMYAKCGFLEDAQGVFVKLLVKDVVTWTTLISRYVDQGHSEAALRCLDQMQLEGEHPNDITLVCSLKACRYLGALDKGREIHSLIVKEELEKIPYVCNTLVDLYVKHGRLEEALDVFQELEVHDVILWTTIIRGYAECEQCEEALSCFEQMQFKSISPDVAAYNAVISACTVNTEKVFQTYLQMQERGLLPSQATMMGVIRACKHKSTLAFGKSIHAQLSNSGGNLTEDIQLATVLVDMYAKCGDMVTAQQLFECMLSRDTVTWTSLIAGYAGQGESDLVFELLGRMKDEGISPDGETFLGVLIACAHAGLVEEGQMFFETMRSDFGIAPTIEHLNCIVDLLGRVGRLSEAVLMLNQSSVPPDQIMWGTVLSACRKWHDVEVARHAFHCAVALDSNYLPAYSQMANIYADAELWEEARIVEAMKIQQR